MTAIGGSIRSISFDGRQFPVTADADLGKKLGGYENEVQANGDGTSRLIKTRVPGMISGIVVEIDDTRGDQEYLQDKADANTLVDVVLEEASGSIWSGSGQLVGELSKSTQGTTMSFDFAVQGKLVQQ